MHTTLVNKDELQAFIAWAHYHCVMVHKLPLFSTSDVGAALMEARLGDIPQSHSKGVRVWIGVDEATRFMLASEAFDSMPNEEEVA